MVTIANIIPSAWISNAQNLRENEEAQCNSAQAGLAERERQQKETDPEDILQKVDLLGIVDWNLTTNKRLIT